MSVLASYEKIGAADLCYIAAVKGAPETLHKMVSAALQDAEGLLWHVGFIPRFQPTESGNWMWWD